VGTTCDGSQRLARFFSVFSRYSAGDRERAARRTGDVSSSQSGDNPRETPSIKPLSAPNKKQCENNDNYTTERCPPEHRNLVIIIARRQHFSLPERAISMQEKDIKFVFSLTI
jgi:hypothetical protein